MLRKKVSSSGQSVWGLLVLLGLLLFVMFLALNRQQVIDQLTVWQYEPSTEISSIVKQAAMNNKGKFLFLASMPSLDDATSFNENCANTDPEGATLGCYSRSRIFIYDIKDERLDGIRQVTAAHEMLHAAYARLNNKQVQDVNTLLDAAYNQLKDSRLEERMAMYEKAQPGTHHNELHSIIGTEYRNISSELESYYQKYFQDRSQVLDLYDSYYSQFRALSDKSDQLSVEIESLSKTLKAESDKYNKDVASLSADIIAFNSLPDSLSYSQRVQLAKDRAALLARMSELETMRPRINEMVATYNKLVEEYNSVNNESSSLYRSIDSSLAPTPSL